MIKRNCIAILLMMAAALTASANALAANADAAKSKLTVTFKQVGVPVEAAFRHFTADVQFDPARPAEGHANIVIDTASLDLGDPEYNGEIGKSEWFDVAHFPSASFTSSALRVTSAGQLAVSGSLSIKGHTQNIDLPVSYLQQGGLSTYSGTVVVKRLAFGLGASEWKDINTLADEVTIKFVIAVPSKS